MHYNKNINLDYVNSRLYIMGIWGFKEKKKSFI